MQKQFCHMVFKNDPFSSIGGSVVEFSPATREARVQFPANASLFSLRVELYYHGYIINYFVKVNVIWKSKEK